MTEITKNLYINPNKKMEKKFKKQTNGTTLFMLCIYELFVIFFSIVWGYASVIEIIYDKKTSDFLIVFIVLVFIGILILDWIMWQLRGYECIKTDNLTLTIKKGGKIFSSSKIINLFDIDNIYLEDYRTRLNTLFVKIIGIRGGKICIEYLGRKTYIGQSLTDKEALENIDYIKNAIYNTKH
jgi:hypothetical protein